jgi:hypothetical protein
MAVSGLAKWPKALAAAFAVIGLILVSTSAASASTDDLSMTRGARRALAQAGNSQLVAARSDSKGKDDDKDKGKDDDDKGKGKNKCALGQYLPKRGACTPCPIGTFSESRDEDECEECPKGSTTNGRGSSKKGDCSGE